jgi:hypothetical protein
MKEKKKKKKNQSPPPLQSSRVSSAQSIEATTVNHHEPRAQALPLPP